MIPIVAALISQGLGMIGQAVLTKGKEVVEEKLGVKLPAEGQGMSPELIVKLKQLEMEHAKWLLDSEIRKAENETAAYKVDVDDRQSARSRDLGIHASGRRNWRGDALAILATIVIVGLVYVVWQDQNVNEYVKGIITLVLGRFLGYLDNIYNFEFSTTRGSRDKDATIARLSKGDGE